jgi:hypothetical protein
MNQYYLDFAMQSMTIVQILQITVVGWDEASNAGSDRTSVNSLLLQDLEAGLLFPSQAIRRARDAM